jgi:hypothetical protein
MLRSVSLVRTDVTSQKTAFFMVTAVKTSDLFPLFPSCVQVFCILHHIKRVLIYHPMMKYTGQLPRYLNQSVTSITKYVTIQYQSQNLSTKYVKI